MPDLYEAVTDRIIEHLGHGTVPWRKTWKGGSSGHPRNLSTGHRYRGINTFLLSCSPFDSPYWLTFKQAKSLGGSVRKGEKATPIIFWKWLEKEDPDTGESSKFPLLRYYSVFNIEQCELPAEKIPDDPLVTEHEVEPIPACEEVVNGMPNPPKIRHGGGEAYYRPQTDLVQMPVLERFDTQEDYYATLFHELTHATGHPSRLDRASMDEDIEFGSRSYSKEELVAEMGAAFLCSHTVIENLTIENSAAYIAGWLKRLRNDKRLVIHAAAAAQKADDFILGSGLKSDKCVASENVSKDASWSEIGSHRQHFRKPTPQAISGNHSMSA